MKLTLFIIILVLGINECLKALDEWDYIKAVEVWDM